MSIKFLCLVLILIHALSVAACVNRCDLGTANGSGCVGNYLRIFRLLPLARKLKGKWASKMIIERSKKNESDLQRYAELVNQMTRLNMYYISNVSGNLTVLPYDISGGGYHD